jgi:hypothetical protein
MKTTSLEELKEMKYGKRGTEQREKYETMVEKEIEKEILEQFRKRTSAYKQRMYKEYKEFLKWQFKDENNYMYNQLIADELKKIEP